MILNRFSGIIFLGVILSVYISLGIHVISLGRDCQIAGQLRESGLRTEAFPFDWLQTLNFEGLCKIFIEDFEYFFETNFLSRKVWRIHNSYYDIYFVHDFPTTEQTDVKSDFFEGFLILPNYLDFLPMVAEKYNRRIKRMQKILNSGEPIFFIRSHLLPNEAKILSDLIKSKYPKASFTIIALYDKYDGDISNAEWDIPNVKAFFMTDPAEWHPHKWWSKESWNKVFLQLKLLKSS